MKILIFSDYYLPGYKAGGPIKSLANLVNTIQKKFNISIITRDCDFTENKPYSEQEKVSIEHLNPAQKILYLGATCLTPRNVYQYIKNVNPRILYLNSFFSVKFSIYPLLISYIFFRSGIKIILAPRGELSTGALKLKYFKKLLYIKLVKLLRINQHIIWHATSYEEEANIRKVMGNEVKIAYAPNISNTVKTTAVKRNDKEKLNIVYLSRITEKKNLLYALKILKSVTANINFNIYGIKEDPSYWKKCEDAIKKLPNNIQVNYKGVVVPNDVYQVFQSHDLFFFPTQGENFGHVILESLASGCPILLSDQTPWNDLGIYNAGWIYPLKEEEKYICCLEALAQMNGMAQNKLRDDVLAYYNVYAKNDEAKELTIKMFQDVSNAACQNV